MLNTDMKCRAGSVPVLIIASEYGFGTYTGEILKAEGFNEFVIKPLPEIDGEYIRNFDILVLTKTLLSFEEADMLSGYVKTGGRLIAFIPDRKLDPVFGVMTLDGTVNGGYIRINTNQDMGKGLINEPLQFHGLSSRYELNSAVLMAELCSGSGTPEGLPAVVINHFGKGCAVAFSYNLPESTVLMRQGNPAWAGQERDGIFGIRAAEMFLGWNDTRRNHINQTDEQMRLLSRIIEEMCSEFKPLPRLWYFPETLRSLVVLTDDGEDSTEAEIDTHLSEVRSKGANMTVFLKGPYVPNETVKQWIGEGHEISGHIDYTSAADNPLFEGMNAVVEATVDNHKKEYNIDMRTVRNHWIVWCGTGPDGKQDFACQARLEEKCGIGLDCNYYHYDRTSPHGSFLGKPGNFTGSGLPMKFAGSGGEILDIYQSITQIPDEQWEKGNFLNSFKTLLDMSLNDELYSVVNVNFHTDKWDLWYRDEGMQMMDYAAARNIPMWTAERLLDFLRARENARFENIKWEDCRLTFDMEAGYDNKGLTIILPCNHKDIKVKKINFNGAVQQFDSVRIKGRDYIMVSAVGKGITAVEVEYAS